MIYTIGILFNYDLCQVLLILKNKPDWQKDKWNCPGGKLEPNEAPLGCIIREISEETTYVGIDWNYIGAMVNDSVPDGHGCYKVHIYTGVYKELNVCNPDVEGEVVKWFPCNSLPENVLPNLRWLIPFAKGCILQGCPDKLSFGTFNYEF